MSLQKLSEFILMTAQTKKSMEEFIDIISQTLVQEPGTTRDIVKRCLYDTLGKPNKPKDLLKDKYKIVFIIIQRIPIPILGVKTQCGTELLGKVYTESLMELYPKGDKQSNQVDLIQKLAQLEKDINCCRICDKKGCKFKSFSKNRTVYFCSIKCLDSWVY